MVELGKNKVDKEQLNDDDSETGSLLKDIIDKEMKRDNSVQLEDETKSSKTSIEAVDNPVLHTGEAGVDGDEVDYHVLKKVVDMAVKPTDWKEKFRMYSLYVVIFIIIGILMITAFWDAFAIRGTMTWQLGFILSLPVMAVVYFWAVEVREKVDKLYPKWYDINSRPAFHYAEVGERDGYLMIMPFKVYKQRVYKPDNPFKKGSPLIIAIDTKCIRKNDSGMITLGRLNYDMTNRATFSVEYDTDYIPNPDIYNLLFELNVTKSSLKHLRELKIEADLKYRDMKKMKFDDEFDMLMKNIRMLLPVLSLMLRSKEHDVISDIALMDKLGDSGINVRNMPQGKQDALLNAIRDA